MTPRPRLYGPVVAEPGRTEHGSDEKARRRAARERIAAYHQQQLHSLLERVRDGFAQLESGDIDEFDLDAIIHRYQRAAAALRDFCGSSGGQWLQAANMLAYLRERDEEPDWWADSAQRSRGRS